MSFLRGGNAPGSTNSCPDNKKRSKKLKTAKRKKKILANHPHPLVSSYDFFDEIYTLASLGNQTDYLKPPVYLPYHHTT